MDRRKRVAYKEISSSSLTEYSYTELDLSRSTGKFIYEDGEFSKWFRKFFRTPFRPRSPILFRKKT